MKPKFRIGDKVRAAHFKEIETVSTIQLQNDSRLEYKETNGYYYQLKGQKRMLGIPQWWGEGTLHKVRKKSC